MMYRDGGTGEVWRVAPRQDPPNLTAIAMRCRAATRWGVVALLWGSVWWPGRAAEAALTLSVTGLRGGSTIELGELDAGRRATHEEVTIRITNTEAVQYRLHQVLSSRLVNERGAALEPERITMELSGGDSGTVRFRSAAPMSGGTLELFTSNAGGKAETLTLLLSLSMADPPQAGTYVGALTYTAQTVDGSSVKTATVPIRLLVQPVVSLAYADGSPDRLRFGSLEPGETAEPKRLSLVVNSNLPGSIQLTQLVEASLVNEQGEELPPAGWRVAVSSAGAAVLEGAVEPRMSLLAGEGGVEPIRRIDVSYSLTAPEAQRAGLYRGMLRFTLTGPAGGGGTGPLSLQCPVELEVVPVLALSVQPSAGGSLELAFTRLIPGDTSPPQTLVVEVRTNTGRAYEVVQELAHLLVSDEGRQLPAESFLWVASGADRGRLAAAQVTPLSVGKTSVYQSDEDAAPVQFSISYQVHVPSDAAAGTYRSGLLFTVTAL